MMPVDRLDEMVSKKGYARMLTFGIPHVFKALQMMQHARFVSRNSFCASLHMGEGAVKTMLLRLGGHGMTATVRSGTCLTDSGAAFASSLTDAIPCEARVRSAMLGGLDGHAILVRNHARLIRTGMEQRDFAIMYGASVALTLVFSGGCFSFPGNPADITGLRDDMVQALASLNPQESDVAIIASATDPFTAELAAKNSALRTLQ